MHTFIKNLIKAIAAFFVFIVFTTACDKPQQTAINVISFNIRYDNPWDSLDNWKYRKDYAAEMLRFYEADIIGAQEVLKNQLDDLLERLPGFNALGVGRGDGKEEGEFAPILFKKDKFIVLKNGHFWLSEQADIPGSMGWDAACERIVTWAIFEDITNGKQFAFYNTHFDHMGQNARRESAKLLKQHIFEHAGNISVIVTRDFNGNPDEEPIHIMHEDGRLLDAYHIAELNYGPEWTFHEFGKLPIIERVRIDYIFVSPDIKVKKYASLAEMKNELYLSDHNPVLIEVLLPN